MRLRWVCAWYDIWVGAYWDRAKRTLYLLPAPCLGVAIEFPCSKEALVLQLLSESPDLYGLQLVEKSKGRLSRGTVYVTLMRMEEKEYIVSRKADPGAEVSARLYRITQHGRQAMEPERLP